MKYINLSPYILNSFSEFFFRRLLSRLTFMLSLAMVFCGFSYGVMKSEREDGIKYHYTDKVSDGFRAKVKSLVRVPFSQALDILKKRSSDDLSAAQPSSLTEAFATTLQQADLQVYIYAFPKESDEYKVVAGGYTFYEDGRKVQPDKYYLAFNPIFMSVDVLMKTIIETEFGKDYLVKLGLSNFSDLTSPFRAIGVDEKVEDKICFASYMAFRLSLIKPLRNYLGEERYTHLTRKEALSPLLVFDAHGEKDVEMPAEKLNGILKDVGFPVEEMSKALTEIF